MILMKLDNGFSEMNSTLSINTLRTYTLLLLLLFYNFIVLSIQMFHTAYLTYSY